MRGNGWGRAGGVREVCAELQSMFARESPGQHAALRDKYSVPCINTEDITSDPSRRIDSSQQMEWGTGHWQGDRDVGQGDRG